MVMKYLYAETVCGIMYVFLNISYVKREINLVCWYFSSRFCIGRYQNENKSHNSSKRVSKIGSSRPRKRGNVRKMIVTEVLSTLHLYKETSFYSKKSNRTVLPTENWKVVKSGMPSDAFLVSCFYPKLEYHHINLLFTLLPCPFMKCGALPVGNELARSSPLESFQMVYTRPVPLCLLKNCSVPFASKFSSFFHTNGRCS